MCDSLKVLNANGVARAEAEWRVTHFPKLTYVPEACQSGLWRPSGLDTENGLANNSAKFKGAHLWIE
jgi:hypothetical protein